MEFDYLEEAQIRPEIPEETEVREIRSIEGYEDLVAEEYVMEDCAKVYLESPALKGLVGFTDKDVIERVDECYRTEFQSVNVDSVEYGNGWAILTIEE